MTIQSLESSLSGLRAAQRQLDLISNNISNAQTEGYTRKVLPQETTVLGGNTLQAGVGIGVRLKAIARSVDKALIRDVVKQVSVSQSYEVTQKYLDRIQAFHGASESKRAISSYVGDLASVFSELSNSPDSNPLLIKTLNKAELLATQFNEFSDLVSKLRNQAQDEIESGVAAVNSSLDLIADLNKRISYLTTTNSSIADLEDQRDLAVKTIAKYIDVSTFTNGNNQLVVMTKQGQTLAEGTAEKLIFQKNTLGAVSYYPGGGVGGLFINNIGGTDITSTSLGGSIGALITLRDETFPAYQAQMDELAQKMAARFDQMGLRLFTDKNGNVPATVAAPGLVGYVGFSGEIQVNADVKADPTLIRSGTNGNTILSGSNEVVRKISQFAFGANAYQEAQGSVDISAGTIFASTGLTQINRVVGTVDLTDYAPDLYAAPNIGAGADQFTLTLGGSPYAITINPGDTAIDLVNNINTAVGSNVASLTGNGQLAIDFAGDIDIADVNIGAAGIADLGFGFGTTTAQDPSFTIQVGIQNPVTISIAATDTAADLLTTLNTISGITASLGGGGELIITPNEGGSLKLTNVLGNPIAAMGITIANIAHDPFRKDNLGPDGTVETGILSAGTLEDYARNIITAQAEDASNNQDRLGKESTFLETLSKRQSDESGVNMDQELSELIRVQTAYSAAARAIKATEALFDELLRAF